MSVNYKAVLCYGIELTHEKELAYIERVGEERWEEIQDDFFIIADGYDAYSGVLGIVIGNADEGEMVSISRNSAFAINRHSPLFNHFREIMAELQEFETQPQIFLICQVN